MRDWYALMIIWEIGVFLERPADVPRVARSSGRCAYVPNGNEIMAAPPPPPDWRYETGVRVAEDDNRPNMHVSRGTEIEFQERRIYVTSVMTAADGATMCKQTPAVKFAYEFRLSARIYDLIAHEISAREYIVETGHSLPPIRCMHITWLFIIDASASWRSRFDWRNWNRKSETTKLNVGINVNPYKLLRVVKYNINTNHEENIIANF